MSITPFGKNPNRLLAQPSTWGLDGLSACLVPHPSLPLPHVPPPWSPPAVAAISQKVTVTALFLQTQRTWTNSRPTASSLCITAEAPSSRPKSTTSSAMSSQPPSSHSPRFAPSAMNLSGMVTCLWCQPSGYALGHVSFLNLFIWLCWVLVTAHRLQSAGLVVLRPVGS